MPHAALERESVKLLSAKDVAEITGMTTGYIYGLVREGRIPHIQFGRFVRFKPESIAHWIDTQEQGRIAA